MIHYPKELYTLFHTLFQNNVHPVIVGGYVRDTLLSRTSKDIDVELYGVKDIQKVIDLLKKFSSPNLVGKSFGVIKLNYKGYDIDFSLPRKDSKTTTGHKGFHITTYENITFPQAAKRRDFTINAMGYDVIQKKFLDPFGGKKDLEKKILKAVDSTTFCEDPLRVLRIIQFAARFELTLDPLLIQLALNMFQNNILKQLPQERIYTEFEKLFLKSTHPSYGVELLKQLEKWHYFYEFKTLTRNQYNTTLTMLDIAASHTYNKEKTKLTHILALLTFYMNEKNTHSFLTKLTRENKLLQNIIAIKKIVFNLKDFTHYDIYKLATQTNIQEYCLFLQARYLNKKNYVIKQLYNEAKKLGVLKKPLTPLVSGKDLIDLGLQPSKQFSYYLDTLYDAQLQKKFISKQEALHYLRQSILP